MKIEKKLRELADKNNNYSMLLAQWEFDKRLLTQALTSISRDFPHYSLHDVSHSNTLILQIEKVIKPNIDRLSATDCWLILESCYWHDCGMIITNEEKEKLLIDPDFFGYLEKLIQTEHELKSYAEELINNQDANDLKNLFGFSHAFTFIFADYYRSRHAMRSGEFVKSPQQISVPSPRTSLIPKRLFGIISEITACHGKSPESILLLPKIVDGMDSEDYAHPRYIAALLRIGDLLDIDDGRFCPTLLASIGKVPNSSLHHQEKHSSIKKICITNELVEIEAECETYDGYYAQQSWFTYIENEFNYQKRVWNEIIPNYDYVALPTLGKISCSIQDYITIDNYPPQIKLNDRVYSYISSQLIYDDEYVYLREIIQNSIDATILKVWETFEHENKDKINLNAQKTREQFDTELKKQVIDISVNRKSSDKNSIKYEIKIKDSGIGISLDDIKKILNVGSPSITVSRKQKILNTMPDWAKPSGFFGIGLHSVFEMCSDVIIKSKQYGNEGYILKVDKRKNQIPFIFIEKFNDYWFSGTEITFTLQQDKIPNLIKRLGNAIDILDKTDPLSDKEIPVIPEYIYGYVKNKFYNSPMKIKFNGSSLLPDNVKDDDINDFNIDIDSGLDFIIKIELEDRHRSIFYYKGMECDCDLYIPGVVGKYNIFSHDSQYWLTIDRKKILKTRNTELGGRILELIKKHHKSIYEQSFLSDNQAATALYLNCIHDCDYSDWKQYKIFDDKLINVLQGKASLNIINCSLSYNDKGFSHYLSIYSFLFKLLGILVRKENKKFIFELDSIIKSEDVISHVKNKEYLIYKVNFNKPDSSQRIDLEIIKKEWINSYIYDELRKFLPCYDLKYKYISIKRLSMPSWCRSITSLDYWFDDFLFLPGAKKRTLEQELNILYTFYKSENILSGDILENEFKEKYKEMWLEIGVIDEMGTINRFEDNNI